MKPPSRLNSLIHAAGDAGRLMVGMPSYDGYVDHMRLHHPDAVPMTPVEFFRDRQNARFGEGGRGGFRCC